MDKLLVINKQVSISPRKMLLIADLVRNKEVISSLDYLALASQKSSRLIYKIVSGVYKQFVNENKGDENFLNKKIYIEKIKIDKGSMRKKIFFRAKGRADTIKQRKCHVTLLLVAK